MLSSTSTPTPSRQSCELFVLCTILSLSLLNITIVLSKELNLMHLIAKATDIKDKTDYEALAAMVPANVEAPGKIFVLALQHSFVDLY